MKDKILKEIERLIKKYFLSQRRRFIPEKTKIPLTVPSYGYGEAIEAIESILSTWVTMGKKVKKFEEIFAEYIGVKHAVMVNSGSSANLIALSILSNPLVRGGLRRGDEVITPAVTWSTTIFPIINVGAIPVLVDVDLETFTIKPEDIEKAMSKKTKAIMPVHLLGNSCEMREIMEIVKRHNLFLIEDCCEAHGAEYNTKKVGSFGNLATFSFFLSHHITTIEGGMVVTNNSNFHELAKCLRAHGWIRELKDRERIAEQYRNIDERFLFVNIGYNFRPTEIQGAFGIHQMKKLEKFIDIRRENAEYWTSKLKKYSDVLILPKILSDRRQVWFGYPLTIRPRAPFTREDLRKFLELRGIETRPIMTGNIVEQPVARLFRYRQAGELKNSKIVMHNSFFFGNHQGIGQEEREYIFDSIKEFIEKRRYA